MTVADIDADWAPKVAERIGEQSRGVGCDVSDPDAIGALVSAAEASFGPIDVFCSNAGFTGPAPGDLHQPVRAWRRVVERLALNYGHRGIRVSCLCPNAVYTGMSGRPPGDEATAPPDGGALGEVLMPEDVAATVIEVSRTRDHLGKMR